MQTFLNFFKNLFSLKPSSTPNFPGIVAAQVLEIQKHPNADRLRVIKLDVGNAVVEPVVCGALNFGVGDIVVLALPGANIPKSIHDENHKSFILTKAKIRGIESQGMICAAFELGLGPLNEKPEIALLKPGTAPGSQFNPGMIE